MTPIEVLKMLKSKIDEADLNKCNYAIEASDIESINQALLLYDVSGTVYDPDWEMIQTAPHGIQYKHKKTGETKWE